RRKRIPS
ncbi:alcohol dehydrogenase GroES-like domain protein, partial [Vibrio parahaemolyticus VPTS-2010]